MSQHKFSMTKFSLVKWKNRKKEKGLLSKKKKGDSKHDLVKNVVFENKGEYVKGERKGRKSIIKSKRIFKKKRDTFKKDNKKKKHGKNRCSRKRSKKENVQKNTREDTQKRKNWKKKKEKKKPREGRTCKHIQICEDV